MTSDLDDLYHELSCYTLAHRDPSFIHQYIVDAYTAQHANETTKPIAVVFALIGLYLHIEKNFTGRPGAEVSYEVGENSQAVGESSTAERAGCYYGAACFGGCRRSIKRRTDR
jgi:Family of unknown function (DUF5946)